MKTEIIGQDHKSQKQIWDKLGGREYVRELWGCAPYSKIVEISYRYSDIYDEWSVYSIKFNKPCLE